MRELLEASPHGMRKMHKVLGERRGPVAGALLQEEESAMIQKECWRAEGVCIDCGKKRSEFSAVHCEACREKHKRACKLTMGKKRIEAIRKRHSLMSFTSKPKTL